MKLDRGMPMRAMTSSRAGWEAWDFGDGDGRSACATEAPLVLYNDVEQRLVGHFVTFSSP